MGRVLPASARDDAAHRSCHDSLVSHSQALVVGGGRRWNRVGRQARAHRRAADVDGCRRGRCLRSRLPSPHFDNGHRRCAAADGSNYPEITGLAEPRRGIITV